MTLINCENCHDYNPDCPSCKVESALYAVADDISLHWDEFKTVAGYFSEEYERMKKYYEDRK